MMKKILIIDFFFKNSPKRFNHFIKMKIKKNETLVSLLLISLSTLSNAYLVKRRYIGCFKDSYSHDLTGPSFFSRYRMTLDSCQKLCSDRNFQYFGVQYR